MSKNYNQYLKIMNSCLKQTVLFLENVASIMLAIMMCLTMVDVIGRYVFSSPIFGASEWISFLMGIVVFSGLGICNSRNKHIYVELFDHRFKKMFPRSYNVIIHSFTVAGIILVSYVLLRQGIDSLEHNSRTVVLDFPLAVILIAIAFLSFLGLFSLIAGLIVNKEQGDQ